MKNSVFDCIKKLEEVNVVKYEVGVKLAEERAHYAEIVRPLNKTLEQCENAIELINEKVFVAEFNDIIGRLASQKGVLPEELDVTYRTSFDFNTWSKDIANDQIDYFNRVREKTRLPIHIFFTIGKRGSELDGNDSFGFSSVVPINTQQKDGRNLGKHMEAKLSSVNKFDNKVNIEIDDLTQLVLPFKFKALTKDVEGKIVPVDDVALAILNACDDYNLKQVEMAD